MSQKKTFQKFKKKKKKEIYNKKKKKKNEISEYIRTIILAGFYSGMVTSTGRQGLLSNLYRNDAVIGLKGPIPPPRLAAKPFPPPPPPPPPPPLPPALPVAGNNPTSSS